MKLVRVREAKLLANYRVQPTLTDDRVVERDLAPLLVGPVFDGSDATGGDSERCAWKVEPWFGPAAPICARTF